MSKQLAKGPWLVFLAALLWASDAPFRAGLTETLSSSTIVFLEHGIAILLLLPLLPSALKQLKGRSSREWMALLFIGIGGSAFALLLFTHAFTLMNPSVVIVLQKLQPLIAISLAVYFLREHPGKKFWLWALLAIGGAYVISFPDFAPRLFEGEIFNPNTAGVALALGAALLWASATVAGRYMLSNIDFKSLTVTRFLIGFIFLLVWNVAAGTLPEIQTTTITDWLALVVIAIISGVFALFVYYRGLKETPASTATLAELGFPVGAVIVNWVFLDATLTATQLAGTALLLFAIWQLSHKKR